MYRNAVFGHEEKNSSFLYFQNERSNEARSCDVGRHLVQGSVSVTTNEGLHKFKLIRKAYTNFKLDHLL